VFLLQLQVMLNKQHKLSQLLCVADLASLDAATATHVIYSASSVAERIVWSFIIAEKIYSVAES
jgi:hypothetical protein